LAALIRPLAERVEPLEHAEESVPHEGHHTRGEISR
jgi:hypothetical protein